MILIIVTLFSSFPERLGYVYNINVVIENTLRQVLRVKLDIELLFHKEYDLGLDYRIMMCLQIGKIKCDILRDP